MTETTKPRMSREARAELRRTMTPQQRAEHRRRARAPAIAAYAAAKVAKAATANGNGAARDWLCIASAGTPEHTACLAVSGSSAASNGKAPPAETDARTAASDNAAGSAAMDNATLDAEIERLAALDKLTYERERTAAAKQLKIRASVLDRLVAAKRGDQDDGKKGRALCLPNPKPWPHPINGAELLDEVAMAVQRYVVMPEHAADIAALWVLHTHLLDGFMVSPRLAITSPEMRCGKTTLIDVLACLVKRPLPTANVTAAAIFRVIEDQQPTLLIDEADTFLPENEELRGILNSGHRMGGCVIRTVGDDHEPRMFKTYAPCAIALIGKLPATLADRSVAIELRRRLPDEPVSSFRLDHTDHLRRLASKAARFAADNAERIRHAEPAMPDGLYNRAADNWCPLLAIADAAGDHWPERARQAINATAGDGDLSVRAMLLQDIKAIFDGRDTSRLSSAELVAGLTAMEGRPWPEWKAGKPISQNGLARLLSSFKKPDGTQIAPHTVRVGAGTTGTPKGYYATDFTDAFARYLPVGGDQTATPPQSLGDKDFSHFQTATRDGVVAVAKSQKPLGDGHCGGVAVQNPPTGEMRDAARCCGGVAVDEMRDGISRTGTPEQEAASCCGYCGEPGGDELVHVHYGEHDTHLHRGCVDPWQEAADETLCRNPNSGYGGNRE